MRYVVAIVALAALTACGANGAPERARADTGLSAQVSVGVGGSF